MVAFGVVTDARLANVLGLNTSATAAMLRPFNSTLVLSHRLHLAFIQTFIRHYHCTPPPHTYTLVLLTGSPHAGSAVVRIDPCKNRPAPFPGRIPQKATKPGSVYLCLSIVFVCVLFSCPRPCVTYFTLLWHDVAWLC